MRTYGIGIRAGLVIVSTVLILWVLVPMYFLVMTSITPDGYILRGFELPSVITFESYVGILSGTGGIRPIWNYLLNSLLIAGGATLLSFLVSIPAAYGLSRLRTRKSAQVAYYGFLAVHALPTVALVLAFFLLYTQLGIFDTKLGLIAALLTIGVPFQIWILRAFFDALPVEIEEAAAIDGAGPVRTMAQIVVPLLGEALAATGLLTFLTLYVDYVFAVTLTNSSAVTTSVYVTLFQLDLSGNQAATCAAAIVSMVPMLAVYAFARRYMKRMAIFGV